MSNYRSLNRKHQMELNRKTKIKLRQHLNADSLLASLRCGFEQIEDHRNSNTTIPLADALMSGFAVFSLKDPSLLVFDNRRNWCSHNLMTVYNINIIPCDTALREIEFGWYRLFFFNQASFPGVQ